jgi:hypothetical protein
MIAVLLFQGYHPIPVDLLDQLQERRLTLEGVELKHVKEAAAVKVGQSGEEAEARPVLAFARMKPLDGQEGLHRATDEFAAHRYLPARTGRPSPRVAAPYAVEVNQDNYFTL